MDPNRERLSERMEDRRKELRLKWTQVGRRGGMSPQNLLRIRNGVISITEDAADSVEDGLFWARGSVQAILDGGEPTLLRAVRETRRRARMPIDPVTSPIGDINAFLADLREDRGADVADELERAIVRVRALAAQENPKPPTSADSEESQVPKPFR